VYIEKRILSFFAGVRNDKSSLFVTTAVTVLTAYRVGHDES
jgi:hypothetical protein